MLLDLGKKMSALRFQLGIEKLHLSTVNHPRGHRPTDNQRGTRDDRGPNRQPPPEGQTLHAPGFST